MYAGEMERFKRDASEHAIKRKLFLLLADDALGGEAFSGLLTPAQCHPYSAGPYIGQYTSADRPGCG
uniref:Uncharacterized protein n=1 Tax=Magnetococcus massalia (strain MO-1) TaxID=451514 RepID=A0A1S7LD54_MAGMO|nr:protein of unknown function [Candidatus Magnetococcus massalia]